MNDTVVRVLMVEDNRLDSMLVTNTLQSMAEWSVDITTVEDGQEALSYLAQQGRYSNAVRPDLVLLDLNLPKHDGLEVLRYIRDDAALTETKVFVFSSSPVEIMRIQVQNAKLAADEYFTKPFEVHEFESLGKAIKSCYYSADGSRP